MLFKSKYSNDGLGAHHFTDPEDGSEYVYTQFEPFICHRAFPCFDQPDLRASLSLVTLAPKDWVVVSNGLENKTVEEGKDEFEEGLKDVDASLGDGYDDGFSVQYYNDTPKIAPYLYAFIAGPYDSIETNEKIPGRAEPLRMRLYFRKTLRNDVIRVQDLMFEPIVQGIHWYSEFFNYNYPYEKYDQIFCPEFKFGAMENVGTVTFTENLLFRGKKISENETNYLINVALHKLSYH